ncbi:hypothetical protein BCIN_06g04350 [Botrytis cinerea B05.10]|uniref:Uncharacterized protein n=1 Tax=Botryotinia fuckeliana (strain B05.10) TaxID=332648 RepID=A0A384JK62_BOTFB|nr:hypothetical protein BCIN_06g04350 [Botrytis cinerea B05.10]ATZ50976.1 hypothetical protein BCIN_06g04350 [Botrytis cinerea B05.10]
MKSVREDRQGRKDVFIFTQLQPQYIFGAISGAMYMYVLTGIISIGMPCGFQTIEHLIRGYMGMIWHEHGTFGE